MEPTAGLAHDTRQLKPQTDGQDCQSVPYIYRHANVLTRRAQSVPPYIRKYDTGQRSNDNPGDNASSPPSTPLLAYRGRDLLMQLQPGLRHQVASTRGYIFPAGRHTHQTAAIMTSLICVGACYLDTILRQAQQPTHRGDGRITAAVANAGRQRPSLPRRGL